MRGAIVSGLAIALLVVGCAGQQETSTESAESPTAAAQAQGPEAATDDGDGTMVVTYQDASSPEAVNGRALLQDNTVLEDLAADINESLILPYDIALIGAECGEANAYWDPGRGQHHDLLRGRRRGVGDLHRRRRAGPDRGDAELRDRHLLSRGRAHGDQHLRPADHRTGRGRRRPVGGLRAPATRDDGRPDPEAVQAVKDFARTFQEGDSGELGAEDFADTHSFGETRAYNLQCWIYGADPDANADLVGDGGLPQDRADGCEDEYTQLDNAWSTLLEPHLK